VIRAFIAALFEQFRASSATRRVPGLLRRPACTPPGMVKTESEVLVEALVIRLMDMRRDDVDALDV
jgi:hypothetical protein